MDKEKMAIFHRENILDASDQLFQEFGIDGTNMAMIAKLANYSTATIYAYFKSKDEIFYCLVYKCMLEIQKEFTKIIQNNDNFEDKYFKICNSVVEFQKQYPLYFEGMIGHINMNFQSKDTPEIFKHIFELGNNINNELFELVELGIKNGILKKDVDKQKLIFFMWSVVVGIVRMTKLKKDYFMLNNIKEKDLLKYSFEKLLNAVKK